MQKNLNLFDLLLNDIYVWETLENGPKTLAIEILARLIAQAALGSEEKGKSHE